MTRGVVVHDPDGLNPYGRELAAVLAEDRYVTLVLARDAEWVPDLYPVRLVLPGNRGRYGRGRQALALALGVFMTAWRGAVHRDDVVVVWTRSAVEEVMLVLLTLLRVRVAVVVHNPVPRVPLPALRAWCTRSLWRRARWRVVHGPHLAAQVLEACGREAAVCAHPPYARWWSWAAAALPASQARADDNTRRLLVLGQLREDKGLHDLHAALRRIPERDRERLQLCICGKIPQGVTLPRFDDLLRVDDRTSRDFVPDHGIAGALSDADVLVAPLTMATQSGSVVLALTAGLDVVAYDGGEVSTLLTDAALVPERDIGALAERLTEVAVNGSGAANRLHTQAWLDGCRREWSRLLDG